MSLPDWPRVFGAPVTPARLRVLPEDFVVEECLGFTPEGAGEHCFLWIEKCGANTAFVARQLAEFAGVRVRMVSYSGMKDRHALTRQWFSVHIPGKAEPDWCAISHPEFRVLRWQRHRRKLKIGAHRGNAFCLRLRDVDAAPALLADRLQLIARYGVPNYFGEQRFGNDAGNIVAASQWIVQGCPSLPPERRGLLLSTLRSQLFNTVLAQRVMAKNWDRAIDGDVFMLAASNSIFSAPVDAVLEDRLATGDIDGTGPLYGNGDAQVLGAAAALEQTVAAANPHIVRVLQQFGLRAQRRRLRLLPQNLQWALEADGVLSLRFYLPKGCFATAVVRELAAYSEVPEQ